jgi:hypothetical protein
MKHCAGWVIFISIVIPPASAEEKPPADDNAALQYWQAFECLPEWQKESPAEDLILALENLGENHPALDDNHIKSQPIDEYGTESLPEPAKRDPLVGYWPSSAIIRYFSRGAAQRRCCFGLRPEDGWQMKMSHLQKMKQTRVYIVLESMRRERRGDWNGARACPLPWCWAWAHLY